MGSFKAIVQKCGMSDDDQTVGKDGEFVSIEKCPLIYYYCASGQETACEGISP